MGVLSSSQVGVRPFRLTNAPTLDQLLTGMVQDGFVLDTTAPTSGWGNVTDDPRVVGYAPRNRFSVADPVILAATNELPRRLRARFYWMKRLTDRTQLPPGTDTSDWRSKYRLQAADVILFEEGQATIGGLWTSREIAPFRTVVNALSELARSIATRTQIATETMTETLSEDLFLWLVYRLQNDQKLSGNLYLSDIHELSSKDRNFRPAKFSETASLERIELAALIALGKVSFGPAKLTLFVTDPAATIDMQLYPDGGFQPFRSSEYEDDPEMAGVTQAGQLLEDLWVNFLPELRRAYHDDDTWARQGRTDLRAQAFEQVRALLKLDKGTTGPHGSARTTSSP